MSQKVALVPVVSSGGLSLAAGGASAPAPVPLGRLAPAGWSGQGRLAFGRSPLEAPVRLLEAAGGDAARAGPLGSARRAPGSSALEVAFRCSGSGPGDVTVALLSVDPALRVGGRAVAGLRLLAPGDTLSAGGVVYVLLRRFRPEVEDAEKAPPAEMCGTCSHPLSLAPYVRHGCGLGFHWLPEPAADPAANAGAPSPEPLPCYLAGPACPACGCSRSFDESWMPEPRWLSRGGGR